MENQENKKVLNVDLIIERVVGDKEDGKHYDFLATKLIVDGAEIKCSIDKSVTSLLFNR